jgi:hypothetical protein
VFKMKSKRNISLALCLALNVCNAPMCAAGAKDEFFTSAKETMDEIKHKIRHFKPFNIGNQPDYQEFIKRLTTKLALGGSLGAATGWLCHKTERQFDRRFWYIYWIFFGCMRDKLATYINKEMKDCGIKEDKISLTIGDQKLIDYPHSLLHLIAQAADWGMYLYLK